MKLLLTQTSSLSMTTVSVIIPAFNAEMHIMNSVKSAINQTLKPLEIIIIDDCSTDSTWYILNEIEKNNKNIKIFRNHKNMGPAFCRNLGIRTSKGKYIAFLDSDDIWLPKKLEIQILKMENEESDFSYSAYAIINENGYSTGKIVTGSQNINFKSLLFSCPIGCLTVIYNKNKFKPLYMPKIPRGQDYGLWLKLIKQNPKITYINEPLALYRKTHNSISSSKKKKIVNMFDLYHKYLSMNVFISTIYVCSHIIHSFLKSNGLIHTKKL